MEDGESEKARQTRERVRRHRRREREQDLQAAVAAARLALGQSPGTQGRSLARWLQRAAMREGTPEGYARLLDEAATSLLRRR